MQSVYGVVSAIKLCKRICAVGREQRSKIDGDDKCKTVGNSGSSLTLYMLLRPTVASITCSVTGESFMSEREPTFAFLVSTRYVDTALTTYVYMNTLH